MGMVRNIFLWTVALVLSGAVMSAQTDRREVRKGNRDFRKENYSEAEIDYRRALVKDSTSFAANYNLGNTLYRNGDVQQARKSYETLKDAADASPYGADYYYNLGNAAAAMEDWQAAVDAYTQSLLRNPGDMDAKENYVYAKGKLKDQQNGGGGQDNQDQNQNQDQDQNQDQNQNQNQNQNQDQDRDQNQNQDNQDDRNQQDRQDQEQGSGGEQPKITPQAAQQMLKAIQAKEKETQEKVNKEKAALLKSRQKEKNW